MSKAIEADFPFEQIDPIAELESWRKEINRPIYHIHKWWAKRLGSVFRAILLGATLDDDQDTWLNFYRKHNLNDKVVLDPFMGSGTTLGECAKLGIKPIGCDINPISTFIVKQALTRVESRQLKATYEAIRGDVESQIRHYYRTIDHQRGETCRALYYFLVKMVESPEGEKIPLFSNYVFSKNVYPKKKPLAQILCSRCWAVNQGRYDSTEFTCQVCGHTFNPQVGPAKRQAVKDKAGRQYKIKDTAIREHFLCLFSSTLEFNNMFCTFKGEGTGAVRHMFSNHILKPEKTPLENSIWGTPKSSGTFSTLFKSRLLRAKEYLDHPFEIKPIQSGKRRSSTKVVCSAEINLSITDRYDIFKQNKNSVLVLNGDSAQLDIPDATVDAVVTDPPYFDFVHYSELSDFFFAWLAPVLKDDYEHFSKKDSSDQNEVQHKCAQQFAQNLGRVFKECYRTLKNDGLLIFSFHHSKPAGWLAIYQAIVGAGFSIVAAHPVKAEMSVGSPKSSARNPINLDAIMVCKKATIEPIEILREAQEAVWDEAMKRFKHYHDRFNNAQRTLSLGDRHVMMASQILVYSSTSKLAHASVAHLLEQVFQSELAYSANKATQITSLKRPKVVQMSLFG